MGPEEILTREGAALTVRLKATASLRPGDTVEAQEWGARRLFTGQVIVGRRKGAPQTAGSWRQRDTIWTDGSRLNDGGMGAVCAWGPASGWIGRCYHLGTNKVIFGAEAYATYQTLSIADQKQESGHRYTAFVDSTTAIKRIRSDSIGSGQRFAVAVIEVCTGLLSRDNEVTIRWVPTHHDVPGNEKADEYAKAAAEPECAVPDEYRWETSLSHMTRVATEARSRSTA